MVFYGYQIICREEIYGQMEVLNHVEQLQKRAINYDPTLTCHHDGHAISSLCSTMSLRLEVGLVQKTLMV